MKTKIYVVRHGEAEGNYYRRCQGFYDSLLTKKAVEKQLPALEKRFSDIPLDAAYSSDILRAYQTVLPIAESHHLPLIPEPGLREMNLGEWEDRPWGELPILFPEEADAWENRPWDVQIPGGETYFQVEKRVRQTLIHIAERHEGKTVLVGTHGVAARSILSTALFGSLEEMKRVGWCDNTAVALLIVEDGEIRVDFLNDNSHVENSCSTLQAQSWWREEDEPTDYHFWFRPVNLEADLDTFLSFGAEFTKNAYGDVSKFDPKEFLDQSLRLQRHYPRALLFAMLRDRECGLLRLDVSGNGDRESGLIKTVIVNEKLRGRGYAPQLLGEAVSVFRQMGKKYISVHVAEGNERAMGFYRKDDFYRKEEIAGHIVMQKKIEIVNPYRQ